MLWKIEKSLGNVAAVQVESVPENGVCIEFKNFQQEDASIIIYQDGKLEDVLINGCVFPCVYNKLNMFGCCIEDIGGKSWHCATFIYVDMNGIPQQVYHNLYGKTESVVVEYFYSFIHNVSYCTSAEQLKALYKYIIDIGVSLRYINPIREEPLKVLNFIKDFTPQLSKVEDTTYIQGLKQKLRIRFNEALAIVSKLEFPE